MQVTGADRLTLNAHFTTELTVSPPAPQKKRYIFISNGVWLKLMRKKLINLCAKTAELASKKENFSEWVRAMLLAEVEEDEIERQAALEFREKNGRWPRWWQA